MNRRDAVRALFVIGAGMPFVSLAQHKQKVWRVGAVWAGSGPPNPNEEVFLAALKDHGYEPGRNVVVESRYAEGDPARYRTLVDEVIARQPDVLLGTNTRVALAMKRRTSTIPIVLGTPGDPVGSGLAESLARPGGNVTGMSLQIHELSAKHIQLLAEVLPRMRRVAVLSDLSNERSITEKYEGIARETAAAKGLLLSLHRIDGAPELRQAFRDIEARRAEALLVNPSPRFNVLRKEIIRGSAGIRVPSVGFSDEWAQDGALVSFGPSFAEAYRRTAYYVDRIFKGSKPGDLPIEQPTKFSLAFNARTAKALGIKIPGPLLVRADRVIE